MPSITLCNFAQFNVIFAMFFVLVLLRYIRAILKIYQRDTIVIIEPKTIQSDHRYIHHSKTSGRNQKYRVLLEIYQSQDYPRVTLDLSISLKLRKKKVKSDIRVHVQCIRVQSSILLPTNISYQSHHFLIRATLPDMRPLGVSPVENEHSDNTVGVQFFF